MTTTVVNKHHKVPYDVYIGRGSPWGNPYSHLAKSKAELLVGSREEAIVSYRAAMALVLRDSPAFYEELRDKVLACYCAPLPCHGDLIARYLDEGVL